MDAIRNVLLVTPAYLPDVGGIENHIFGLKTHLEKNSIDVDVVHIHPKDKEYDCSDNSVIRIPAIGNNVNYKFTLPQILTEKKYDIVHIHDPHVGSITRKFCKYFKNRSKIILSSHGGIFHNKNLSLLKQLYWNTIARINIRKVHKVIAVSKTDLIPYKKISNNLILLENGVICDCNNLLSSKPEQVINFIYFGRFVPHKNVLKLIDVFNQIDNEQVKLYLVGSGERNYTLELVNRITNKNIVYKGFLDNEELNQLLESIHYFISLSKYEGFGMAVIEAMNKGLVPIINNIEPINEFVQDKISGYTVEIDEVLPKLFQILGSHNEMYSLLSLNSKKFGESYCWENKVNEFINLYKSLYL